MYTGEGRVGRSVGVLSAFCRHSTPAADNHREGRREGEVVSVSVTVIVALWEPFFASDSGSCW